MAYNMGLANEAISTLLNNMDPSVNKLDYKQNLLLDLSIMPANEAVNRGTPSTAAGRGKLVNAMFKDVISKKNTDFGSIPVSKGNIANFVHYDKMCDCMDTLNNAPNMKGVENMARMNQLHEAIVAERQNFEFGFKCNIDVIVLTYCTLVTALMDLIQINIVFYGKTLNNENIKASGNSYKTITKAVDSFLSMRKSGDWKRLIESYKTQYRRNFVGGAITITAISAIGVVALIFAIRNLIFLYYHSAVTIDEKARALEAYLDSVMMYEQDEKALKKQQRMAATMASLAGTIETKIIKDTATAEAELTKVDRNMSTDVYSNSDNDVDIEAESGGFVFL